ncbi:NUMOD4 domain-containing protein [Sulfuricurvum sp. MLSB]|uniref:NUMOD4 domain-containing protein n=1 Tax=Sulfuricurvum sp. MLSB TaxID=1537917 RepID=UPI0025E89BC5|nr:NUMOD4 domain-containing protein [Sulfuricurvum sp. MLSB]
MKEVWVEFGSNGKYLISNHGRVMSNFKYSGIRKDRKAGYRTIIRKPQIDRDGYLFYCLNIDGVKRKTMRIHKEVFRYFVDNTFTGKDQICHYDGDKNNNSVSNLYKGDVITNTIDKMRHGTIKLTPCDILRIREFQGYISQREIGELYGISQSNVSQIQHKKTFYYI